MRLLDRYWRGLGLEGPHYRRVRRFILGIYAVIGLVVVAMLAITIAALLGGS